MRKDTRGCSGALASCDSISLVNAWRKIAVGRWTPTSEFLPMMIDVARRFDAACTSVPTPDNGKRTRPDEFFFMPLSP